MYKIDASAFSLFVHENVCYRYLLVVPLFYLSMKIYVIDTY